MVPSSNPRPRQWKPSRAQIDKLDLQWPCAPTSCSERWASSNAGGRAGDRGNSESHHNSGHVLKKAPSREQRDKLRKHQSRGGARPGEETGEQWGSGCDTAAGLIGLGGNPKVCCTGIRAENSLRKKQGPVPTATFPMPSLTLCIYTPLVGPFPLLDCTLNVYVSLSLWTCVGCYFELDPGFI